MSMVVGVCTVEIHLPFCQSLKDKRRVLKSLIARLRGRHNISFAEVDSQDLWQRAVLGITAVASARGPIEKMFASILAEIETQIPGEITAREIEYL